MALSFKYTFTYEEVNPSFFYLGLFLQVSFGGKGELAGGEGVYIINLSPGVVQYNLYLYWCKGIPCSKPESFLCCC